MTVGVAWYYESDYVRLLEMFEDGDKLHRTYDGWLQAASNGLEHLTSTGMIVERVYLIPDEFAAWCAANNKRLDSKARTSFVNEKLGKKLLRK